MKEGQRSWTREELILIVNLYYKLPFGRLHSRNPDIINLASLLSRTPGAVAYKLVNLASLDPSLQARGIRGAVNASKLDKVIWDEFYYNENELRFASEKLLAQKENTTVERLNNIQEDDLPKEGKTRDQIVKIRVNQSFFRKTILASYNNTCCITGIQLPELLVAGHIKPWSLDEKNRLNPQNGIAINALHDKAFESGLITITPELKIKICPSLLRKQKTALLNDYFLKFENQNIFLPSRFLPDKVFLEYHNKERFRKE